MTQRVAYVVAAILILAQAGPASAAQPSSLQSAFASAASEFRVPQNVLLAVSYVVSRWENDSAPSAAGGYGPMQLFDAPSVQTSDGKGASGKAVGPATGGSTVRGIAAASTASGISTTQIKASPTQNIRAGAALLAAYARDTVGATPADASKWYGAAAKYSGSDEASVALGFADDVFSVIKKGARRTTSSGETVALAGTKTSPDTSTAGSLTLLDRKHTGFDCPTTVQCRFIPAAYHQNSKDPGDYGNYDLARREADGLAVRFVVIHDTEVDYQTTIKIFQDSLNYVSSHYVLRSSDGQITQMVDTKNVAWHAGNWNVNMHAIGFEHEGFAIQGTTWYTEAMYQASAALTKYLAAEYGIPLDRAHIIGHDDIPGPAAVNVRGMHWDPGPFWNWARYMALVGAPIVATATSGNVVTIAPDFATNMPQVRDCEGAGALLAAQPANFVYLYTSPSLTAPLFNDPGLASSTHTTGTDCAADWGDKADTGQTFYRVQRMGDWDQLYYAGNTVWFYDPGETKIAHTNAQLITPKAGATSIPVYGRAYPESISTATLTMYSIPAGQKYVAYEKVKGDYYEATTFNNLDSYVLHTTPSDFYMIQFNHRLAFVKASDVNIATP